MDGVSNHSFKTLAKQPFETWVPITFPVNTIEPFVKGEISLKISKIVSL